ncbi:MAG: glycoside hydrolase family 30 protein [Bacilli bacterium]|jgi:glucosylceramidase
MIRIKQTVFAGKPWKNVRPLRMADEQAVSLRIDPDRRHQTMLGFGAAFTEAACYTFYQAPPLIRHRIMRMYFSSHGLRYRLGRLAINSCDFSLDSYTYVQEGDPDLRTFSLDREEQYVIPTIKWALRESEGLSFLASPWSPPAYMKSNHNMKMGGKLLPRYQGLWADYIAKYLHEMRSRDIPIEYLTVQNEPEAIQTWESCGYTGEEEGRFIGEHLIPSLKKAGLDQTKILIWDHNRDQIVTRALATFGLEDAKNASWGLAYHWYVSDEHENLTKVHELYPDKHLLFTEGCVEYRGADVSKADKNELWSHGEMYGRHMINDFNNFTEGWIDWNFLLNEMGGPNHARNYCEAPLMYDRKKKRLIVNPSYYYIGHFSRFVDVGARRLERELSDHEKLYAASFMNPNGTIVTVIQNEGIARTLAYDCAGRRVPIKIPSHSITTLIDTNKPRRK